MRVPPSFDGIVDTLFASGMFGGDGDDYHDPRNSLLHEVLARRVGMPITLSVVAMEVGKRLGVPIRGVGLPGHFVIRDKQSGTFADPFGGGVRYDEAGMIASWKQRMGGDAAFRPSMLSADGRTRDRAADPQQPEAEPRHPRSSRCCSLGWRRCAPRSPSSHAERDEHRRWMRHFN